MFVGTPQYASPEQLTGATVDARSDLFSAAVVAFEMLAGRPPFTGNTLPALAHAVMYSAPPVLTGAAAVAAADRVLHRALSKAPAERYSTAEAFAANLRAALAMVDSGQAGGRAADSPAPSCRFDCSSRMRTRPTSARVSPMPWPARSPASSRWWCARR